jgi:hypothetical protein
VASYELIGMHETALRMQARRASRRMQVALQVAAAMVAMLLVGLARGRKLASRRGGPSWHVRTHWLIARIAHA